MQPRCMSWNVFPYTVLPYWELEDPFITHTINVLEQCSEHATNICPQSLNPWYYHLAGCVVNSYASFICLYRRQSCVYIDNDDIKQVEILLYSFLPLKSMVVSGQLHALADLSAKKKPGYLLNMRPSGFRSRSARFGEEKNIPGVEDQFRGLLARSLFTVPTRISRLHIVVYKAGLQTFRLWSLLVKSHVFVTLPRWYL